MAHSPKRLGQVACHWSRVLSSSMKRKTQYLAFGLLALFSTNGYGQALTKEMKLKSAYIFNFAKYIDWPADELPVSVCMQGNDAMRAFMTDLVRGRRVGQSKRAIQVGPFPASYANTPCDIVFLTQNVDANLCQRTDVLVVGNDRNIEVCTPLFSFFESDNKLRFEVDLPSIQTSGIKVSSELLKLAKINNGK